MIFNHCGFSRKISYREKVGKSRWRRLTNCGNIFQVASVTTVEYANEILRKLFLGQYHKSLLILDDVWSSQIIKSFDVCAKVLVTTQDITVLDVISKNNVNVVKMQPFTQEESLKVNLFLHTILKLYFLSKNSILGKKIDRIWFLNPIRSKICNLKYKKIDFFARKLVSWKF